MPERKPPKQPSDKIEVEPGAEKRLANILTKALNTPPSRRDGASRRQSNKKVASAPPPKSVKKRKAKKANK